MSTATFTPFATVADDVRDLPKKACLGYVDSIGEPKLSTSGEYVVQPIVLAGTQGAPAKSFVNLLYRPEWLRPGFKAGTELKAEGVNPSYIFVYRMHIGGARDEKNPKGALSTLAGIAGSMDNFYQLTGSIQDAILGVEEAQVADTVRTVLAEFINENTPTVGYILKQKEEATGEVVNGKKVKVKTSGYEVGNYFFPEEDGQFIQKQGAAGKVVVTFEQ